MKRLFALLVVVTLAACSSAPPKKAVPRFTDPPPPTDTPAPTNTLVPTDTPTPVRTPSATPTINPCLNASYLADVTVPDGSRFDSNVDFVKTWRVRNSGKCDWETGAAIGFQSGDKMGAPDTVAVDTLKPGQRIDISVPMKSPVQAGKYRGIWRMKDANGSFFGEQLTVAIVVGSPISPTARPRPTSAATATPKPTVVRLPTVAIAPPPSSGCCKHCTNSQPCGDSCISWSKTCHQPPGCACP